MFTKFIFKMFKPPKKYFYIIEFFIVLKIYFPIVIIMND